MYDLKIEKMIGKNTTEVFNALKAGKLFMNCSADSNSIEIDFRIGGKYKIDFKNHGVSNWGDFLEIVQDKKIVFTWCQTFGADQKPDTLVTIELFADGPKTKLVLMHSGFHDQAQCDNHYGGWNGGLNDLTNEMEHGRIRMVRGYDVSVEQLFDKIKNSKDLFGEAHDMVLNQKMIMPSNATLTFSAKADQKSSLEIIHEGLLTDEAVKENRKNWDRITMKLTETI